MLLILGILETFVISCEMIILRNNSHGEIIKVCMGIINTASRNKKITPWRFSLYLFLSFFVNKDFFCSWRGAMLRLKHEWTNRPVWIKIWVENWVIIALLAAVFYVFVHLSRVYNAWLFLHHSYVITKMADFNSKMSIFKTWFLTTKTLSVQMNSQLRQSKSGTFDLGKLFLDRISPLECFFFTYFWPVIITMIKREV